MDDKLRRKNNIHAVVVFDEEEDGSDERADKRKLRVSSGWNRWMRQR